MKLKHIIEQIPGAENGAFMMIDYTIGGMMIFPANKADGKMTINYARGFTQSIVDRMDLSLECICRHYIGQSSLLSATPKRYADFFALFLNASRATRISSYWMIWLQRTEPQ